MARRKEEPLPADIAAMSFEEVRAAYEATKAPGHHAIWDEYCRKRDEWQEKMEAHSKRNMYLLKHYSQMLCDRHKEKELV